MAQQTSLTYNSRLLVLNATSTMAVSAHEHVAASQWHVPIMWIQVTLCDNSALMLHDCVLVCFISGLGQLQVFLCVKSPLSLYSIF